MRNLYGQNYCENDLKIGVGDYLKSWYIYCLNVFAISEFSNGQLFYYSLFQYYNFNLRAKPVEF